LFVLSDLLIAIAKVLDVLIQTLEFVIVIRVILVWVNADPYNRLVQFIGTVTEPFLSPFRKLFPPWKMHGWDISPVCALLCLFFLRTFLIQALFDVASRLR
jgi:YggT family protein